jgi:16S rRNA (uracil1498-N3)-methyltransferase
MTPRVLLETLPAPGEHAELSLEQSHYLLRVLRLRAGDPLQIFDGQGARFEAQLAPSPGKLARVLITGTLTAGAESPLRITLAQCISAADKMDWTIEKAVELGVAAIQPLISSRSVVKLDEHRARKRTEHWSKLIESACMQCGRDLLPSLGQPMGLREWLASVQGPGIVLDPTASIALPRAEFKDTRMSLLVGPESGLSAAEIEMARAQGFTGARLGPRVLRTETAGLAAIAVLQSCYGDFNA